MHLSDQGLIVILVVGIVAGWLAGKVVRGSGFGLVGDAAIGIVGALIGDWLLHRLGIHFAPVSSASSSTPQSERLFSCSLCGSPAPADGAAVASGAADPAPYIDQESLAALNRSTGTSTRYSSCSNRPSPGATQPSFSSEFLDFLLSRRVTSGQSGLTDRHRESLTLDRFNYCVGRRRRRRTKMPT